MKKYSFYVSDEISQIIDELMKYQNVAEPRLVIEKALRNDLMIRKIMDEDK